jgi:type IV secretion system protein TrbI
MQDKKKLELRAKPNQSVQVNKPVVLVIVAVVVLLVLFAIINAFSVKKNIKTSSSTLKVTTDKPVAFSAELNDLPTGYGDVNAIQRYSSGGMQRGEMTRLQQQLNELKGAYRILEQQLRTRPEGDSKRVVSDPQTEKAKLSSLVFSGVGAGVENLIGAGAAAGGARGARPGARTPLGRQTAQQTDLVATPEQEKFFAEQAENNKKIAVMKASTLERPGDIYDLHGMVKPVSKYQIQAGTVIPASLITAIETTVSGTIVAQVRQNVFDTVTGKYLLIPRGSKLLGEYNTRVLYGQGRIMMIFTRVIRPDGSSILLGRPNAADMLGQSGLKGNVDNHWGRILGAATISTLLSVGAGAASDSYSKPDQSNSKQGAIRGAAQGISGIGQNITNKAINISPTITLPAGKQFIVTVKKDMVLTPYKHRR